MIKTEKVTTVITVETLSEDSVPAMVDDVISQLHMETRNGELVKDDGDTIRWETIKDIVEF